MQSIVPLIMPVDDRQGTGAQNAPYTLHSQCVRRVHSVHRHRCVKRTLHLVQP